jgi:transposase
MGCGMPRAYAYDLRIRVIELSRQSYTDQKVADLLSISLSTVRQYKRRYQLNPNLEPNKPPGRPRLITKNEESLVRKLVNDHPDQTLPWFCEQIKNLLNKIIGCTAMFNLLKKLGFTRKKNLYIHPSKTEKMFRNLEKNLLNYNNV